MLDCAIMGNGILGLSLAFRLKKNNPELKLAVIGPSARPGSATLAAGAMLNVWAELVDGLFEDPYLAARFELPHGGMEMWEEFADEVAAAGGHDIDVAWGTYVVDTPMSAPWGDRTWRYFLDSLVAQNVKHRIVDPLDVPSLAPGQHSRPLNAAWIPDGRLDPVQAVNALEAALRNMNVEIIDNAVIWLEKREPLRVHCEDGTTFDAGRVVFANGSFAQEVIDQIPELKFEIPRLVWGNGAALDLTFPDWVSRNDDRNPLWSMEHVLRGLNPVGACGLHVVPQADGRFYVGATSAVLYEREWDPRVHAVNFLLRDVVRELNRKFAYATVKLIGCGFRPVTVDAFPLLGESNVDGIWFLNGMKRDGLTSAPYLAREMARAMNGQDNSLPEMFRPARKLLPYKTREIAMEETVLFSINSERQHELSLPPWADEAYAQRRRDEITRIYEKRGITDFAIHPEVTHLYDNDVYFSGIEHSLPAR